VGGRDHLFFSKTINTGSRAHLASYSMGTVLLIIIIIITIIIITTTTTIIYVFNLAELRA